MADFPQPIDVFPRQKLAREDGPLYQQLVELIQRLITSGQLEIGSDLPKEAEIEEHLGVSLITVRRALRELEDLGLIQKRSAKPARVMSKTPTVRAGFRFQTYQDLTEFARGTRLVIVSYGKEKGALIEKYFGLAKGEAGYCLRGYLALADQPRTLVTTYFPPDIGAQISVDDFTDVLIFRNVQRVTGVPIDRVLVTARADIATKTDARALNVSTGSPLMTTEMIYLNDKQRVVEVTQSRTSSEYYTLSYDISLAGSDG